MKITMRNQFGQFREVKRGFSWTTLFFGLFVPLTRGDYKWAIIMLLAGLCTFGISWLVFPFLYNGIYEKELIRNGYIDEAMINNGFGFNQNNLD